eukprot:m.85997 g.85997  ORF g.85997 m.85997 type:complete len:385 (+) comp11432_c0_seq1:211-1365(+)
MPDGALLRRAHGRGGLPRRRRPQAGLRSPRLVSPWLLLLTITDARHRGPLGADGQSTNGSLCAAIAPAAATRALRPCSTSTATLCDANVVFNASRMSCDVWCAAQTAWGVQGDPTLACVGAYVNGGGGCVRGESILCGTRYRSLICVCGLAATAVPTQAPSPPTPPTAPTLPPSQPPTTLTPTLSPTIPPPTASPVADPRTRAPRGAGDRRHWPTVAPTPPPPTLPASAADSTGSSTLGPIVASVVLAWVAIGGAVCYVLCRRNRERGSGERAASGEDPRTGLHRRVACNAAFRHGVVPPPSTAVASTSFSAVPSASTLASSPPPRDGWRGAAGDTAAGDTGTGGSRELLLRAGGGDSGDVAEGLGYMEVGGRADGNDVDSSSA